MTAEPDLGGGSVTSQEVIRRAIEFEGPERLPISTADVRGVGWNQIGTGDRTQRATLDEWGCTWVRSDVPNMGIVKGHPLADWSALARYRWPDPDDPAFYAGMEARFAGSEGKYLSSGIFMLLFERMHTLHGFENTLADLYLERENIEMLADRIVEFDLGIIGNIARRFPGQIHGFGFTDDWGSERGGFISPQLWDEFFKPRYKRLFDAMHAEGWHVWMHSCGKLDGYIDSLIEIGVNVLNLLQPRVFGSIEAFGQRFAGRVCFETMCDIQHTLPLEDDEAIRAEAELLLRHWGTPEGGFILADYGDGVAIGVPPEKKQVMMDAFLRASPWRR